MQSDDIAVNITLTPADVRTVSYDYFRRRWFEWVAILAPLLLFNAYTFVFEDRIASLLVDNGLSEGTANFVTSVGSIAILFVLIYLMLRIIRARYRREGAAFRPQRITASTEGIRMERDGMTSDTLWRVIEDIRFKKNHTLILIDPRCAYVVPKRSFLSEAEFAQFNEVVQRHFQAAHPAKPD